MSVAGPCEWCGGPQKWTIRAGEMFVHCDAGCLGLELEPPVPPPDSEDGRRSIDAKRFDGTRRYPEGVPQEGRETKTTATGVEWPGDLPRAFLDAMWEGCDG